MGDSLDFQLQWTKNLASSSDTKKRTSPIEAAELPDIVASYQEAIVDVLVTKTMRAAEERKMNRVVVVGGVAANSRLRARFTEEGCKKGIGVHIPAPDSLH